MGDLIGFVYGEELEQGSGRSLGYRLLAPLETTAWRAEVEALARRLQAAPYPDLWPASDLFCSVLLADGHRLVALARYGLSDHTSSQRRGGLELIGVIGPADLDVSAALALYRWLQQRRASEDDLPRLGGRHSLLEVLALVPTDRITPRADGLQPVPVLPIRLWQDGALLFAAGTPGDPDQHLRLLDLVSTPHWQWLPLVGPDFPLPTYAQRGPVVAWTPHLTGVAVKLDRKEPSVVSLAHRRRSPPGSWMATCLLLLMLGLLAGNLWYMSRIHEAVTSAPAPATSAPDHTPGLRAKANKPILPTEDRDRFARALYQVLVEKGGEREWREDRAALLERYEQLVRQHPDLAVAHDNEKGKRAVAACSLLARRSADQIEESIRRSLTGKGFSDRLIKAACEHVREQLANEVRNRPDSP
jgi:hypothetical protein